MALLTLTLCFILATYTTDSHPANPQENLNLMAIHKETVVNALMKVLEIYRRLKMESIITLEKEDRSNQTLYPSIPPIHPAFPTLLPSNNISIEDDEIWIRGEDNNLYLIEPKPTPTTESTEERSRTSPTNRPETTPTTTKRNPSNNIAGARFLNILPLPSPRPPGNQSNNNTGARSFSLPPPSFPHPPVANRPGTGNKPTRGRGRGRGRGRPSTSPPTRDRNYGRPSTPSPVEDKGVCSTQISEEYTRVTGKLYDEPTKLVTLAEEIYPRRIMCGFNYPSSEFKNRCIIKGFPLGAWIKVPVDGNLGRNWKRCRPGGYGYKECWDHIVVPGCCVMSKESD